jgi:uncharacterized FlaG/YvyC family protein
MDVSATGQAVAAAVSQANVETVTGSVSTTVPQETATTSVPTPPAAAPAGDANGSGASSSAPHHHRSTLAPAIAKLFAVPGPAQPISLNVSYRVERDPNVIVTVFTDPKTGEEVAQFPPEVLFNLAQFFDQQRGVTLDRNA